MSRILVIRGGAIGDFILTLPVLQALKESFPDALLEVVGYPRIAELVHRRHYAAAIRSIESRDLAMFFARNAPLPVSWCDYLAGFSQVVSFLYDPDGLFRDNLTRAGVKHFLQMPHKPDESQPLHAVEQFVAPLQKLAVFPESIVPRLYPSEADRTFARDFLRLTRKPVIAIHPGSGGVAKNWPAERWLSLVHWIRAEVDCDVVVILGEADEVARRVFHAATPDTGILYARNLELPQVAAILAECRAMVGHDSGISHMAAATGIPVLALFGPTNPAIWAPVGATVLCAGLAVADISPQDVQSALLDLMQE